MIRQYLRFVAPTAPALLRHVAQTLSLNAREGADANVTLPSLRDRAKLVVRESDIFVAEDTVV